MAEVIGIELGQTMIRLGQKHVVTSADLRQS